MSDTDNEVERVASGLRGYARDILRYRLDTADGSLAKQLCEIIDNTDADEHEPNGSVFAILDAMVDFAGEHIITTAQPQQESVPHLTCDKRLSLYPDYLDDAEGLQRMVASLKAVDDWRNPAPINCNSLSRLLDTVERLLLATRTK